MSDYEEKALRYAEKLGIYEYSVNGHIMQWWTFWGYGEGWVQKSFDLDSEDGTEFVTGHIDWLGFIPECLKNPETGATKYNYMVG